MNLYSIDIKICATAYIKAESEESARAKAESMLGACLEVEPTRGGEIEISSLAFNDPDLPEISLSPIMTVWEHYPDSLTKAI